MNNTEPNPSPEPALLPPASPSRVERIVTLAQAALTQADDVRKRIRLSIEDAQDCGRLLVEEKRWVEKTTGKGQWGVYFTAHFQKHVPERTARNWMHLAAIADCKRLNDSNRIRLGISSLDLVPDKQHVMAEGEEDGSIVVGQASHLSIVNKFVQWSAKFESSQSGPIPTTKRRQLLADLEPIARFIRMLMNEAS